MAQALVRYLAAQRTGAGSLESRLTIERARSTLNVKRAELAALRAMQADDALARVVRSPA